MAARGPQNGGGGLERCLPLGFGRSRQLSLNKFFDPSTPSEKRLRRRKKNGEKTGEKKREKKRKKEKTNENSGHYVIASSQPPERPPLERRTLVPFLEYLIENVLIFLMSVFVLILYSHFLVH